MYDSPSDYILRHIDDLRLIRAVAAENLLKKHSANVKYNEENKDKFVVYNIGD